MLKGAQQKRASTFVTNRPFGMAAKLFAFLFDIPQLFCFFQKHAFFFSKKSHKVVFLLFFVGVGGGEGGPFHLILQILQWVWTQLHNFPTISIPKVRVKKRDPKNIPSLKLTYC